MNKIMSFKILRCAVLGDGTVGKTALITKYCHGETFFDYIPTIVDTYERLVSKTGTNYKIQFTDLAGQEDYAGIRRFYYDSNINIIILVFDLTNPISLENIERFWINEIKKNFTNLNIPILLVGTKLDLVLNRKNVPKIENSNIINLIELLNCKYVECSSLTGAGIENMVDSIIQLHETFPTKRKRRILKKTLTV